MEPFIEDIFDKISCYFPINFTPPKDDKFKITPIMLKSKLKSCFLASEHPALLENIFPFILEKMTQENVKTKIECLDLLVEMSVKFSHQNLMQHLEVTLSTISNEYFNRFEADI
jgi:DNA repair/transcription protein MET18/MMS19